MKIGDKLRLVIAAKYNRIGDLADKFDMNYSQLSQYLNNRDISIAFLSKVIHEFPDVDLNWLLRNEETQENGVSEPRKTYKTRGNKDEIITKLEAFVKELKSNTSQ